MARIEFLTENQNLTVIFINDLIDNSDQGCFACTVRAEQSENGMLRNVEAYII
jgi:predicted hotdog family 3-hydroxylacyl-ACP dehydratase